MNKNLLFGLSLMFLIFTVRTDQLTFLVQSLMKMCGTDQNQTISLYQCQQKLKQVDRKKGVFKDATNYQKQTFFMTRKFDVNKDSRLSKEQLFRMGARILESDTLKNEMEQLWSLEGEAEMNRRKKERITQEQVDKKPQRNQNRQQSQNTEKLDL